MTQTVKLITVPEAAIQLKVSQDYVHQLVQKQRLKWVEKKLLDAAEVEKLAQLMGKLRQGGIAALVDIAGKHPPKN